jgi:prepilin-type processing-associated H-X9-DG protein
LTGGCFYWSGTIPAQGVRIAEILDGTSNTALYAEIKRGSQDGVSDPLSVTSVPFATWDAARPGSDLAPMPECNNGTPFFDYTGLQYYRALLWTAWYTHTVPPNYKGRDCVRSVGLDRGHIASRSYHSGGVNVCRADGSVAFVRDSISLNVWRAFGTRAGGEVLDDSQF